MTRFSDSPYRYFYPRPPRGGRPEKWHNVIPAAIFLSTPSARRATAASMIDYLCILISIHALREEGDWAAQLAFISQLIISIHALREEGDGRRREGWTQDQNFYPRPPRGGRRNQRVRRADRIPISIHALREEGDSAPCSSGRPRANFYPRPPRGGRPCSARRSLSRVTISIHALREEGDLRG